MKGFGPKRYFFVLPAIIFTILFAIYPLIYNVVLSFKDVTAITLIQKNTRFIGLSNYKEIFMDPIFRRTSFNTLMFTVFSILFQFIIGFLIALLFNKNFPLRDVMISLVMLPWFIPILVSGTVFKLFFMDMGLINRLLLSFRLITKIIPWITDGNIAIYSLIIANIWLGIPFNFIMLYTGLKGISEELYEASEIDGAIGIKKTIYITVPLLKPVIISTLLLGAIFTIKVFDLVWIITGGGPGNASHLFSTYSYQLAFGNYNFGLGSAVSVIMILIIVSVTIILNLIRIED
ncbi:MAG: sugar ABC transporter permease [bacterium]|nr:sugar ABC transporter permease [bacterium]